MRKSLSKKITQILFLTSIGVIGYTATQTSTVYAKSSDKSVKTQAVVKQDEKKKANVILNIIDVEYGKFYSDNYEYRVNYNHDEVYEKAISEILVNGKKYSKGEGYSFHYYGLQLNPKEFTKDENKVVITANGYDDVKIIIKKDGTFINYKEVQSKAPLLNVGDNLKVEEGQPIDLLLGVSAKDNKDGDLIGKIQVNKGKLDINNPSKGIYTVSYLVTNSLGKTITASKKVEVTERSNTSSNSKTELVKVTDKIQDGVYTLGFEAYKTDRPNETSMLGGFFDKNVKVTVKNGKITLKMLNLMNAEMLYDFRVESKGKYAKSKSQWVGESNTHGEYFMQTFEFPIEDLLANHTGGVLVSAMGGQKSDIGNTNKYTKVKLVFDKILKKGWNGFEILNKRKSSDELLNKALKDMLSDENKDGKISNEEIAKAKGMVELVNYHFKDITRLKYLGEGVTGLNLEANEIDKLPQGVFDNLINLEHLKLTGNNIKELPKGIFDKLTNLKTLILSANKIEKLPKGIFDKLISLEKLEIATNKITEIEDGVFDKLINIKNIYMPDNNIKNINDNAFGDLKNLKGIFLADNKLENIPKGIGRLENLEILSLNNNKINSLPKEVGRLKNLTDLDLSKNYIKDIPKEVYEGLKNIRKLDISDNLIKEVPENILEKFPHAYNLDFSMNKIKNTSKIKNKDVFRGCPQKTEMNLSLSAKDGEVKWNQNIDALDMLYWAFMITRDKPKDLVEYEKFMKNEKSSKNIKDIIPFEWSIINEIQRKNINGKYETIKKFTILNDNDMLNGKFKDPNMKKGSEYRIVKSIFTQQGNRQSNEFNDVVSTVAESDAIKNQTNSKKETKSYDLKVKILKEKEDKPSMAETYVKKVKYEVKDGKYHVIVKLNRSDWMNNIKITVDGEEITPEILNKEKNDKGEEISDVKFRVKGLDSKIALGMDVKPMGNTRVNFRIVPEEESLNLIKKDLKQNTQKNEKEKEKPKDNIKDLNNKTDKVEEKQQEQNQNDKEKQENKQTSKDEFENTKKQVKNKKTELENIKKEIEKNKKKIEEEKTKLKNQNKEKNGVYNLEFNVLKEKEDNPSMAATYLKKVDYEIKDGNHYIRAKLNRSDWMHNIKATVDGKEVTPEILNKQKNDKGEETSDIRFKVKDLNSKMNLAMNVEPMGNAKVGFRVVPKEESINRVLNDSKNDILKTTPELEKAKEEIKKLNEKSKKVQSELNEAQKRLEKVNQEKENSNKPSNDPKEPKKEEIKNNNQKENSKEDNKKEEDTKKENEITNSEKDKPIESLSHKDEIKTLDNLNTNKDKETKTEEIENNNKKDNEIITVQEKQSLENSPKQTNEKGSDNNEETGENSILKELPQTGSKASKVGLIEFGALLASIGGILFKKRK